MSQEQKMAGTNLWMIKTEESEHRLCTLELPAGIQEDDIQSVGCGEECLSLVTKKGRVHTKKIQNNGISPEWKQPPNLTNHVVSQVQSGLTHCVALSKNHKVVTWGKNDHGQLGQGQQAASNKHTNGNKPKNTFINPRSIQSLQNIKVLDICCGNNHSLCLSEEGHVYSWGANDWGQLGRMGASMEVPKIVQQLRNTHIVKISAGGNHNFAMSVSGNVFCWGSNRFGQLGIASDTEERRHLLPVECPDLCAKKIDSICCGSNHTAVLTEDGCVFTCGQGSAGQLGHNNLRNEYQLKQVSALPNTPVTQIACGRIHTVAWIRSTDQIYILGNDRNVTIDFPNQQMKSTLLCGGQCSFVYQSSTDGEEEASASSESQLLTLDLVLEAMKHSRDDVKINNLLEKTLSNASCINGSFLKKCVCLDTDNGIDFEKAETFFKELRKAPYQDIAKKSLKKLLRGLTDSPLFGVETLRLYLLLPCCLYADNVMYDEDVVASLARLLVCLDDGKKKILGKWLKYIAIKFFTRFVWFFKMCLMKVLNRLHNIQNEISKAMTIVKDCIEVLDMLNQVNLLRRVPVSFEKFHINELMEKINIEGDFLSMMQDKRSGQDFESMFRFCKYPFLYNSASKFILLKCQCKTIMQYHAPQWMFKQLVVSRDLDQIVDDTRVLLTESEKVLRQEFNVIFKGETPTQTGDGIRQEYFRILLEKMLDPDFGVFIYEEGSNVQWFKKDSNLDDVKLIGLMCGLALYNSLTVHLEFPLALYKKLLKKPLEFEDLLDVKPRIHREDDVNNVTDHHLNTSVEKEFNSFFKGFYTGIPESLLSFFHPQELEEVLIGNEKCNNLEAFEKVTEYAGGYDKNNETIKMFWEVFHEMEVDDQKAFLRFLTGTDRIPAYGIKRLKMTIIPKDIPEVDPNMLLPKVWTCTYTLMLPRYTSKKYLKMQVLCVAQNFDGFDLP